MQHMSDKEFVSTESGTESNEVVEKQSPDQFFGGEGQKRPDEAPVQASHATRGMTHLGFTEASRLEDTAAQQDRDRKLAEKGKS